MAEIKIIKPKRLLQIGDIIRLDRGKTVYADVPYKFIFSNVTERSKDANEISHHDIKIGTVLSTTKNKFNTGKLAGWYVVIDADMEGGGTGMGDHDVYPDGHHVFARKLKGEPPELSYNEKGTEIDFYQTGCFTAMIEEGKVPVLKGVKMKKRIVMEFQK